MDERHLLLFARQHWNGSYFYRLSDSYEGGIGENVDDLVLPQFISDLWFRGRASRDVSDPLGITQLRLAPLHGLRRITATASAQPEHR